MSNVSVDEVDVTIYEVLGGTINDILLISHAPEEFIVLLLYHLLLQI